MLEDVGDPRRAVAERAVEPAPDRVVVRERADADALGKPAVEVLQVHVPDPRSCDPRHFQRISATERDVTGVETEGEAGLIQKMHDVMTPLDHGSEVWVHDRSETALVGD